MDCASEFTAALEAEYADHPKYACIAAPEEMRIIEPWDARKCGIHSLIWINWMYGLYERDVGKHVDVEAFFPAF
jgi:hypothetical protein